MSVMASLQIIILLSCLFAYEVSVEAESKNKLWSENKKVCMPNLGCFELSNDFKGRIINLLPQHRFLINTRFLLYTRNNPYVEYILVSDKPKTLINSPIDVSLPTKFIVHGFLDTVRSAKWIKQMKDELMARDEYNIILVDWIGGNQLPYSQAVSNTRVVGAEIAFLINQLQKYVQFDIKTCHIIGHSLGAHIAGYAGERLNKLNRITALDPAKPYFEGMPSSVRIDPSDAEFVDVIHTDSESAIIGYGMRQLAGHVDFFPNDGKEQPGCETHQLILSLFTWDIRNFASCSHQRAVKFFISSINLNTCKYVGHRCSNWNNFVAGKCARCGSDENECAIMGLDADQFKVKDRNDSVQVFLKTGDREPFCMHHYRITIGLSSKNVESSKGKIKVGVADKNGKRTLLDSGNSKFVPGTNLTFLSVTSSELNLRSPIDLVWLPENAPPSQQMELNINKVEILPMNYKDIKTRIYHRTVYYKRTENPIKISETVEMYPSKD